MISEHKRLIAFVSALLSLSIYYSTSFTSSINSRSFKTPSSVSELNPYEQPGRLVIDEEEFQNNIWFPLTSVSPSFLMASLYDVRNPQVLKSEFKFEEMKPEARGDMEPIETILEPEMNWIVNKTILLLGDSIDRYFLKDFCHFHRGRLISVQFDQTGAPKLFNIRENEEIKAHKKLVFQAEEKDRKRESDNELEKERENKIELDKKMESKSVLEKRKEKEANATRGTQEIPEHRERLISEQLVTDPWVCDLKELGFTMISVFFYGIGGDGAEEHFGKDGTYFPPVEFERRVEDITLPLLENLAVFLNRPQITTPVLIQVHAGFWDLRKFSQEDFKDAGRSPPYPKDSDVLRAVLSPQREKTWEKEARLIIKNLLLSFPSSASPVLWRTMNVPSSSIFAPTHRVVALNAIARFLVSDMQRENPRLILNDFGAALIGADEFYRDDLHPNAIPASWVNGDRLLWELKRATLRDL